MPKELKEFAIQYKLKSEKKKLKSEAPEHEVIVKAPNLTAAKKKAKNAKRVITGGWEINDEPTYVPSTVAQDDADDDNDDFTAPDYDPCGDYDDDDLTPDYDDSYDEDEKEEPTVSEDPTDRAVTAAEPTAPETPQQRINSLEKVVEYLEVIINNKEGLLAFQERRLDSMNAELDLIAEANEALDMLDATDVAENLSREDLDYGSETPVPSNFVEVLDLVQDRIMRKHSQDEIDAFQTAVGDQADIEIEQKDQTKVVEGLEKEINDLQTVQAEIISMIDDIRDEVYAKEVAEEEAQAEAMRAAGIVATPETDYCSINLCGEAPGSVFEEDNAGLDADNLPCNCFACFIKVNWMPLLLTLGIGLILGAALARH